MMSDRFISLFTTRLGSGSVQASEHGICSVSLPDPEVSTNEHQQLQSTLPSSPITERAAALLQRYFSGERIQFDGLPVDLTGLTLFRSTILTAIRSIPYGEVRSYGQVAAECNSPRAARAIGGAMASNPVPVIIPCHRIVGSDGRLTGFSAPGGKTMKMELLKIEGVEFKGLLVVQNSVFLNRSVQ